MGLNVVCLDIGVGARAVQPSDYQDGGGVRMNITKQVRRIGNQ